MKRIFALAFLAALNLTLVASEIWGNDNIWGNRNSNNNTESEEGYINNPMNDSPIFGSGEWLRSSSRPGGWDGDENIGNNEKDPAIPVGEGVLILLAGGAFYTATKLRRKK